MKRLVYFTSMILLVLAGCRQGGVDSAGLVELDWLIATAPDSAAALLQAYPDDSLRNDADRAYHALLLTQAKYKAFIPLDNNALDTINLAVAHYADGHDHDKRTRSVLYKGCTFEDQSQLDSAMYYYKAAEDCATQAGDTYHRGYALMRMAWLYQTQQSASTNRMAADKYRQALDLFKQSGNKSKQLDCMMELSSLLYPLNADSALCFAKLSEDLCRQLGDGTRLYITKRVKAQILFDMEQYTDAKNLALGVLNHTNTPLEYFNCILIVTQAYCKLGQVDSAEFFINRAPAPISHRDTVLYFRSLAELQQARHEMKEYVANSEFVINSIGTMENSAANSGLSNYEAQVDKYLANCKSQAQRTRLSRLLLCLLIFIFALGCAAWLIHRKRVNAENLASKLDEELHQLSNQLSQLSSLHEQDIHDKSELEAKLGQETSQRNMLEEKLQQEIESKRLLQQTLDKLKEHCRQLSEHPTLKMTDSWVNMLVEMVNKFNSKKQKDQTLKETVNKEIFTDELLQCLAQYIDAKYDGLATKVAKQGKLNSRDFNLMCMHFSGFSNAAIKAYLGTTDDHYVTTRKRIVATTFLHNSASINNLITYFASQQTP